MKLNLLKKRPVIGLALGGGGPKGLAHIGVIKTLERNNIPVDLIAGTSAGSIVGAFYAARRNIAEIEDYIMNKNWLAMLSILADPSLRSGLFQGRRAQAFLEGYLGKDNLQFSDLKIPFQAVAVDLGNGKAVSMGEGPVVPAVLASCAVPMLFKPVRIGNRLLVDGGVTSPVPVETVRRMGADIVIAVNLNKQYSCDCQDRDLNFFSVAQHSFSIMMHNIASYETKSADLLLNPDVHAIHWRTLTNEKNKQAGIRSGEESMERELVSLKILIRSRQPLIPAFLQNIRKAFS